MPFIKIWPLRCKTIKSFDFSRGYLDPFLTVMFLLGHYRLLQGHCDVWMRKSDTENHFLKTCLSRWKNCLNSHRCYLCFENLNLSKLSLLNSFAFFAKMFKKWLKISFILKICELNWIFLCDFWGKMGQIG
jgi:hypothetical protein